MSKIEWTNETWNPIVGCSKISEGCKNCYAEKMAFRLGHGHLANEETSLKYAEVIDYKSKSWNGKTRLLQSALKKPLKRKKPTMYFVCSMGDLFHESVPFEWIHQVMHIIMLCPQHTFQILTKRPEIMLEYFEKFETFQLNNIWLGVTAENQKQVNNRIPVLLQIPAKVHFVSIEPMLAAVDFWEVTSIRFLNWIKTNKTQYELNWVICGGETGHNARPIQYNWVKDLYQHCQKVNIPFFFKQWGEYAPKFPGHITPFEMLKVGKNKAGCLLDGEEYKQFPNLKNSK